MPIDRCLLPIAHAITLFIASRSYLDSFSDTSETEGSEENLMERAWRIQHTKVPSAWSEVGVDKRCLERLEEEMFERSALAGVSKNCQWGFDVGDHQDCWDPYNGIPDEWNHRDRASESEGELQMGPSYIALEPPEPKVKPQTSIKPRPLLKKRKNEEITHIKMFGFPG